MLVARMSNMDLNFVSEIISTHSETEVKYLNDSIQNVSERVSYLKLNVKDKMDEKYKQFKPVLINYGDLLQSAIDLEQDLTDLQQRLDTQTKRDIQDLAEELQTLKEKLIESTTIVEVVEKLCRINSHLKEAEEKAKEKHYYESANHINAACKFLNEDCKDLDFLHVYKELTQTASLYRTDFCNKSIAEWKKCIVWTQIDGDLRNNKSFSSLLVSSDKNTFEMLLKTLEMFDVSDQHLSLFGDNLLKKFLIPIVRMDSEITVKKSERSVLELSISSSSDSEKSMYKDVLENLTLVFQFIDEALGVSMNHSSFMSTLGDYIADDFLNLLIDECLSDAIPLRRDPVKNYAPIIDPITEFRSHLIQMGFLPENNKLLEDYFGNVETLFLNKKIEKYSDLARSLMKRDMHEFVEVGDSPFHVKEMVTPKSERSVSETLKYENVTIEVDHLCPNLFRFPKCCVSKSVEDFLILINGIIAEGFESDGKTCAKLHNLARDIVLLYQDVVPMYHSKLLHDIPQYSALLHNNLMYLSHQILTMNFKKSQTCNTKSGNIMPASCFADLISSVRNKACQVLSEQISRQQKILLVILKDSGLTALSEYEQLPESTEKSIKGCLRQLYLLKTVWENVLPINIYTQVIGGLCTVVIDEITNRIVATSDIRANIATSLVSVLSHIETEAPSLFPDPVDAFIHVKSWAKLKELILVLSASLAEVGERWADGKGPLANEFTADQVRQMVKALFQVSERRAAVLSRIK